MELSSTSILLILGYIILIVALITIIISYANYKDEKEEQEERLNKKLSESLKNYNLLGDKRDALCATIKNLENHKDELKCHLDSEHASSKKLREIIAVKTKSESSLQRKVEVLAEENKFLIEHGPKILKLNVAAKLYDKLVDGTEIAVPLANKDYWKKQLIDSDGEFKEYHLAEVSNGRREGYQTAKFIINYVELSERAPYNEDSQFFHVYLGERLN